MANALNKVNSGGIEDGSIVNADIKSDAAIAKSKLASLDIVNADVNASAAIALSKLASTPAVLTGSTNNQITTVTGANAIQGEANLTFDGTTLNTTASTDAELKITAGNATSQSRLLFHDSDGGDGTITYDHNDRLLHIGAGTSTPTDGDLIIDSSGNVKIGEATTDYTYKLTVSGNGSTDNGLFMYDGDAGTWFGIKTEAANGLVVLTADARTGSYPPLSFKVGNSEKLRIQSGGGISFNGDTAAANALDDYEEGSWTPTLVQTAGVTLSIYGADYTKIGRMVHAYAYVYWSGTPSSPGTNFQIGGLPFTAKSGSTYGNNTILYMDTFDFTGMTPIVMHGNNYVYFHVNAGSASQANNGHMQPNSSTRYMLFAVSYMAA